jgi:broad specificity phosphatase PhoE
MRVASWSLAPDGCEVNTRTLIQSFSVVKNNKFFYDENMKWPLSLVFIRHGQSEFNALKERRANVEGYDEFKKLFERDFEVAKDEQWVSTELKIRAQEMWQKTRLLFNDFSTPLTKLGISQAEETGKNLKELISLPDVIYVSPYLRTRQTLEGLTRSWPELAKQKIVHEERIREQEHGLAILFNDWRLYHVFNPYQALLFKLEGEYGYRYLNGESKLDVKERVRSFFSTLIRENANENVLMISHHLTLMSLRANLERMTPEQFIGVDKKEPPINCGVTIYRGDPKQGRDGKLLLEKYNEKLYS